MQVDPSQAVREGARFVSNKASFVSINSNKLHSFCDEISDHKVSIAPSWDSHEHYVGPKDKMAVFVLQLAAINYGASSHSALKTREDLSPYRSVAQSLTQKFVESGPFSVSELTEMTAEKFCDFLQQPRSNAAAFQLMGSYAQSWRDLGHCLSSRYDGSFEKFFSTAQGTTSTLISQLLEIPSFQDLATFQGEKIPFFCRAQMCASDLNLVFLSHNDFSFETGQLTAFANETVPHILHAQGILKYEPSLERKITRGEMLSSGSVEEVEIRALTIVAVDEISKQLKARGKDIAPRSIDFFLWREAEKDAVARIPSHWSDTIFY